MNIAKQNDLNGVFILLAPHEKSYSIHCGGCGFLHYSHLLPQKKVAFLYICLSCTKGPSSMLPSVSISCHSTCFMRNKRRWPHLCLFFPGFSFFSPALSTCVRGSIVYIPDMLSVSMDHIPHVCRSFHQHLPAFPSFSIIAPLIFQCKSASVKRTAESPFMFSLVGAQFPLSVYVQ